MRKGREDLYINTSSSPTLYTRAPSNWSSRSRIVLKTGDIIPTHFISINRVTTVYYYYYYCYYQFYYYCTEISNPNVEVQFYLVGITEYPSSYVFNPRDQN